MKSFSIKLFGIAGAALMFSSMAFGQAVNAGCDVIQAPAVNFIRAEGQTEVVPPFNIRCATVSTLVSNTTIQLFLSPTVTVTTPLIAGSSTNVNVSVTGATGTPTVTVSGSTITLSGVVIPVGGTTLTVSNVRVNATAIPSTSGGAPSNLSIQGFLSGSNTTPGSLAAVPVAYVTNGLAASSIGADSAFASTNKIYTTAANLAAASTTSAFGVCGSLNNSTTTAGFANFYVKVAENFVSAFKTQGEELLGAASGTRFKVTVTNIPTGLNLYMPVVINQRTVTAVGPVVVGVTASAQAQISESAATNGTANQQVAVTTPAQFTPGSGFFTNFSTTDGTTLGATSNSATGGLFQVPVSNNTATAIYEITADAEGSIDTFVIPVYLQTGTNALPSQSTSMSVAVSFAPVTGASTIPSFAVGTSTTTTAMLSFTGCTTTLLFPFVSNASGFETGIAISNTTIKTTPTGFVNGVTTTVESGTCNLAFFGTGGTNPATVQAPNPNEGGTAPYATQETYAFTLSQALAVNSANPATFTGFILAQCNFRYAHGFAYITYGGLGTPNAVAMGYLAELLARGGASADTVTF